RILRETYLDELPQIWNVLRGDLSLVGPRPTSAPVDVYEPWHTERLNVTPGITCLWQIVQDDVNDFNEHMLLDIVYVRRCCWMLDVQILFRPLQFVLEKSWGAITRAAADD